MITTIPGSGALVRQLRTQFSRHRSQQPLLGLKKPSPRPGFARLDSHKTKPCEAELCPGLLALLPALQALCWGAGAELCATDGSIGSCKGAVSQRRRCGGGAGRTGTGHSTSHSLGCWRMMDFGVSNLSSCSFPLLMARTQHCIFTPQIITPCLFLLAARDCREKGLLLRHSQWWLAEPGRIAVLHVGKEGSAS